MLQRFIGEDNDLVTLPGSNISPVGVDPAQLEQVLFNLVVNCRDAMPSGGKLTIETSVVFWNTRLGSGLPALGPAITWPYRLLIPAPG